MTAASIPISSAGAMARESSAMLFPGFIGFFFVFRVSFTYLFFQADPVAGSVATIVIGFVLCFGAILYSVGERTALADPLVFPAPMRWMLTFFVFTGASIGWSEAQSLTASIGYWFAMTADVAVVLLLLRGRTATQCLAAVLKGAACGAVALAAVAWCSPATDDLRLGNNEFLHPNTLGLELGIATLIAQYLAVRGALWKWLSLGLGITLLRTLSKTAIVAFILAESWYLMQSRAMTRKAKVQLCALAVGIVGIFWGLINAYLTVYNTTGSGNQAETLTGRTILWATTLSMSMEKPWFGHGFYSFKALIPTFGHFAAVHAHNELLQQFFEFGLVGAFIAIALYGSFWRQVRRASASELRTLAFALLIFSLLRGLADTVPIGLSYHLWLMALLSVCLASPKRLEGAAP